MPQLTQQLKSGKDNDDFWCWKFRSMTVNKNSDKLQATKNDSRITKLGAIMRKTSIDELPQFFNVLMGRMSIVGPRPHMLKHTEEYAQTIDKYMFRHFVKPGITGLAQVKGFRGETKDPKLMEARIKMDMLYVESLELFYGGLMVFNTEHPDFNNIKNKMEEYVLKYDHVQDQLLFPIALKDQHKVLVNNTFGIKHKNPQMDIPGKTY